MLQTAPRAKDQLLHSSDVAACTRQRQGPSRTWDSSSQHRAPCCPQRPQAIRPRERTEGLCPASQREPQRPTHPGRLEPQLIPQDATNRSQCQPRARAQCHGLVADVRTGQSSAGLRGHSLGPPGGTMRPKAWPCWREGGNRPAPLGLVDCTWGPSGLGMPSGRGTQGQLACTLSWGKDTGGSAGLPSPAGMERGSRPGIDRPPGGRGAARDHPGERTGILSLLLSCCETWTPSPHLSEPGPSSAKWKSGNDDAKQKETKQCLAFCQANRQQVRGSSRSISGKNIKTVITPLMGH